MRISDAVMKATCWNSASQGRPSEEVNGLQEGEVSVCHAYPRLSYGRAEKGYAA